MPGELQKAIKKGNTAEAIRILLKQENLEGLLKSRDGLGETPLQSAVHVESAIPNKKGKKSLFGKRPMIKTPSLETTKALIDNGADPNDKGGVGLTPYEMLVKEYDEFDKKDLQEAKVMDGIYVEGLKMAKLLYDAGADIHEGIYNQVRADGELKAFHVEFFAPFDDIISIEPKNQKQWEDFYKLWQYALKDKTGQERSQLVDQLSMIMDLPIANKALHQYLDNDILEGIIECAKYVSEKKLTKIHKANPENVKEFNSDIDYSIKMLRHCVRIVEQAESVATVDASYDNIGYALSAFYNMVAADLKEVNTDPKYAAVKNHPDFQTLYKETMTTMIKVSKRAEQKSDQLENGGMQTIGPSSNNDSPEQRRAAPVALVHSHAEKLQAQQQTPSGHCR